MKRRFAKVLHIEREQDWRFFDIEIGLYDNPEDNKEHDCTICAIGNQEPDEILHLTITDKDIRDLSE